MKTFPIPSPLPGEHLAATSPRLRPDSDADRWRLRLNFWAGRALTADALELEQDHRGSRLAGRGRLTTPGIIRGLDVALEPPESPASELTRAGHFVHVLPGHGIVATGDDVVVPRPLRIPLDDMPVDYVRVGRTNHQPPSEAAPAGSTPGATIDTGDRIVLVDRFGADRLPWAAVLLLCPAELGARARVDPNDPCELDPSQDAFADERRIDASMVRLVELPADWRNAPELADDADLRWRNQLAHVVLTQESRRSGLLHVRRRADQNADRRWDTVLEEGDLLPWEFVGVPLALFSSELPGGERPRRFFLDRAAVARPGGGVSARTRPALAIRAAEDTTPANAPGGGSPRNWRARIEQFAAHLGELVADGEPAATLNAHFQFIPPAGFLPRAALDFLTTAEALALPPGPGQRPDRAGVDRFFTPDFVVDAVPVTVEDLDAALASSAALAPYDIAAADEEPVRVLVPVPQRAFDAELLVVEVEDPIFEESVDRFVAARQGWRQRRDVVRSQRDALDALVDGTPPALPAPLLEPGQVEPEPVETAVDLANLGLIRAFVSPIGTPGPWDLSVEIDDERGADDGSLFVLVRADEDRVPSALRAEWVIGDATLSHTWTQPFPAPPERTDEDGTPAPSLLWLRLSVPLSELGTPRGAITALTLHLDDGRLAFAETGRTTTNSDGTFDEVLWRGDRDAAPTFTGGDWTAATGDQLFAPFETAYEPVFPDGLTRAERVEEVKVALSPPGVTPPPRRDDPLRPAVPLTVEADGLTKVLVQLEGEASEADDFVDAHFTRAQINLYRIRKLMLGHTAAQKLLVNPAIALIAEQETASASAEQLQTFIAAAKQRKVTAADANAAVTGVRSGAARLAANTNIGLGITAFSPVNPVLSVGTVATETLFALSKDAQLEALQGTQFGVAKTTMNIDLKAAALKDVFGERPESGPTLPPRGLSIGQRFVEPPATQNLSYARADLNELLKQLTALRLPLIGETVKALDGKDVLLIALQGRVVPPATPPGGTPVTSESIRLAAITTLLTSTPRETDTDEAEVTLAALDFTEIKSAILRTIERVVQRRRAIVQRGLETARLISEQSDAAAMRVLVIEGNLAEARQDVSVARALRQEEQARIAALNDRRDAIIRDEVTFLAYARPRTVDLVRRTSQYWQLERFDAPAPVPACLQRHDEPPAPLHAYVELFTHAPVRWFTALEPLLARLDTREKVVTLIETSRQSAVAFKQLNPAVGVTVASPAVQFALLGAHQVISTIRERTTVVGIPDTLGARWQDVQRDAREHATVGDLIAGRFGARDVSTAATGELELIGQVATCLHAEFASVAPAVRLAWIERFSQFDRPALLRDLTVLPEYGRLDRPTRRRLQQFVDWLFGRFTAVEGDAVNLVNDLVRICLLLATHAPVNQIIAGHVPRPTPVRPGIKIPIRPLNPGLVRVGMQFQVWQAAKVVAHGLVEDLVQGEVTAHVQGVDPQIRTIEPTMRVQFIPPALKLTFR
jgi:hypothetical protein